MLFANLRRLTVPSVCLTAVMGGCEAQPTDPTGGTGFELVAAAASVNSESTERQVLPIDIQTVFTCDDGTEHTMWVFGEVVVTTHQSIDRTGRTHASSHWNPDVSAVDALGRTYRGGFSNLNLVANDSDGSFHQTQSIRLIGKAKAPNFRLHIVGHRTTGASGDVTVDFHKSWVSCQ